MKDSAPSHAERFTISYLQSIGFNDKKFMTWPTSSPDRNPRDNFRRILKMQIYRGGQQYMSKDALWRGICDEVDSIGAREIQNPTKSVDGRLVDLLSHKGTYGNK